MGVELGVLLVGVEADLVAVGVVQVGQDPADAGPMDPGVLLAQRGQPGSEFLDRFLAGHADGEVVEARGRPGSFRVEPQAEQRAPVGVRQGVAHQLALLDELDLDSVAQPGPIPLPGAGKIGHRQFQVVKASQLWRILHVHNSSSVSTGQCVRRVLRPGRPSPQATTPIRGPGGEHVEIMWNNGRPLPCDHKSKDHRAIRAINYGCARGVTHTVLTLASARRPPYWDSARSQPPVRAPTRRSAAVRVPSVARLHEVIHRQAGRPDSRQRGGKIRDWRAPPTPSTQIMGAGEWLLATFTRQARCRTERLLVARHLTALFQAAPRAGPNGVSGAPRRARRNGRSVVR